MANVIQSSLSLSVLSIEDSTGNVIFNRSVAPILDSIFAGGITYFQIPNGVAPGATLFPLSSFNIFPAYCGYVRNLSPNQTVELSIVFIGDATSHQILGPGGVWLVWNTLAVATPAINGINIAISSVSACATANLTPIEYFFGG